MQRASVWHCGDYELITTAVCIQVIGEKQGTPLRKSIWTTEMAALGSAGNSVIARMASGESIDKEVLLPSA